MISLLRALWRKVFGETVRRVEADSLAFRMSPAGQAADWKAIVVLLTTAIVLTLQNFGDHPYHFVLLVHTLDGWMLNPELAQRLTSWLVDCGNSRIDTLTWWATSAIITYVLLPVLVIKLVFGERVLDYGVKLHGLFNGWPIYLVFVLIMGPIVWIMSDEPHFQQTYPFYELQPGEQVTSVLIRWEIQYALQFVALEFFFRGFMVHGLKHRFGVYSVLIMMVPYCMIHFRKPFPECVASIVAGIALGFMSLKTRSVWLGAALHISVAWSMDFASLYRKGFIN